MRRHAGRAVPATRSARWSAWRSPSRCTPFRRGLDRRARREHAALRAAVGGGPGAVRVRLLPLHGEAPRLRRHAERLHRPRDRWPERAAPEYGRNIAIDGSDMPAYANGQRFVSKNGRERAERVTATRTRRGGTAPPSRRARAAASTATSSTRPSAPPPAFRIAWNVRTAREAEQATTRSRCSTRRSARGFAVETARDGQGLRHRPDLRRLRGPRRAADHPAHARPPPSSAATTSRRRASTASGGSPGPTTAARRRSGAARPASASPPQSWIKADRLLPLIPRETPRFTRALQRRAAVEREFGRLKHEWALLRFASVDSIGSGYTPI